MYCYCIAGNFCIQRSVNEMVLLGCEIPNEATNPPLPFPTPSRSWFKDGELVYIADLETVPDVDEYTMANPVLITGVLTPDVFSATADGTIFYNTEVENITFAMPLPPGTTVEQARVMVFDGLLGNWTCVGNNTLGSSSVTNIIRECGE